MNQHWLQVLNGINAHTALWLALPLHAKHFCMKYGTWDSPAACYFSALLVWRPCFCTQLFAQSAWACKNSCQDVIQWCLGMPGAAAIRPAGHILMWLSGHILACFSRLNNSCSFVHVFVFKLSYYMLWHVCWVFNGNQCCIAVYMVFGKWTKVSLAQAGQ